MQRHQPQTAILQRILTFTPIYQRDKQGLWQLDTRLLLGSGIILLVLLSAGGYRAWLSNQQHTLKTEIAQLTQETQAILKTHPDKTLAEQSQTLNIQSVIGYLSTQHLEVENVTSVENNKQRLWKAEGQLNKQELTPFVQQIDTDNSLLNLIEFQIEQNNEKPDQLKISLSGYLR